ncbi:MAG: hypothetical protein AAB554_00695 [Patescibacteria group bacterium]
MPKDDGLKTLDETIAELDKLPKFHPSRIWLNAIKSIMAGELTPEAMSDPADYECLFWEAMITVGSLSDGRPRFHIYPVGTSVEHLASRDAAIAAVMALTGVRGKADNLIEIAGLMPSTTFAAMIRARAGAPDGPLVAGFFRHPSVSRSDAVGWLKLTVEFIRSQESSRGDRN